jgi:hypothetical protein
MLFDIKQTSKISFVACVRILFKKKLFFESSKTFRKKGIWSWEFLFKYCQLLWNLFPGLSKRHYMLDVSASFCRDSRNPPEFSRQSLMNTDCCVLDMHWTSRICYSWLRHNRPRICRVPTHRTNIWFPINMSELKYLYNHKFNGRIYMDVKFGQAARSRCLLASCWFPACHILRPWKWMRYVPPKRRLTYSGLRSVISKTIESFK